MMSYIEVLLQLFCNDWVKNMFQEKSLSAFDNAPFLVPKKVMSNYSLDNIPVRIK